MKRTFVLTSLLAFAALSPNDSGYGASPSPDAAGLCVPVRGSFCGEKVPESPDPLVAYRWERPLASDNLEHYELHPLSIEMRTASGKTRSIRPGRPIRIDEPCTLMLDFGQVNAGWLAFDSDDLAGEVEIEYQRIYRAGRAERRRPASRQNGRRRASGRKYLSAETERRALRRRPLRVDSCPVGRSPVHDLCDPPDMPDQADELRGQLRLQRSLADPHLVHRSLHRQAEPAQGLLRRHPDGAQRPALMDGRRPPVAGSLHGGLRKLRFRKAKPLLHLDPVQRHRGLLALLDPEPGRLFRLYGRPADVSTG